MKKEYSEEQVHKFYRDAVLDLRAVILDSGNYSVHSSHPWKQGDGCSYGEECGFDTGYCEEEEEPHNTYRLSYQYYATDNSWHRIEFWFDSKKEVGEIAEYNQDYTEISKKSLTVEEFFNLCYEED